MIIETSFKVPKGIVNVAMRAGAQEDELAATMQQIRHGMENEVDALLVIETTHKGNDWAELVSQPQAITERLFVGVLIIESPDGKTFGNMVIGFRVPNV